MARKIAIGFLVWAAAVQFAEAQNAPPFVIWNRTPPDPLQAIECVLRKQYLFLVHFSEIQEEFEISKEQAQEFEQLFQQTQDENRVQSRFSGLLGLVYAVF